MPKYVIEIDSEHDMAEKVIVYTLQELIEKEPLKPVFSHITIWRDDDATFIGDGEIIYEGP